MLEMQIVLLPEYVHVYAIGKTVSCSRPADMPPEYTCRIACEFILIRDEDREAIIQHVFRRQKSALRNKRLQNK